MPLTAHATPRGVVAVRFWAVLGVLVALLLGVLGMHVLNGSTGASGHSGMATTAQPIGAQSDAAADASAAASGPASSAAASGQVAASGQAQASAQAQAAGQAQATTHATTIPALPMPSGSPAHILGAMACLLILVVSALVLGPLLSRNGWLLPPRARVFAIFRALRSSISAPSLVALSVDRR